MDDKEVSKPNALLWNGPTAARKLGISAKQLALLARAGKIPYIILGRQRMYPPSHLRQMINAGLRCGETYEVASA